MVKGSIRYISKDVALECEEIMREYNIQDFASALKRMAYRSKEFRCLKFNLTNGRRRR